VAVLMTSIGALRPDGADALARYAAVVIPLIEAAGGAVLGRGVLRERLVGDEAPEFIAVMQFPDAERARTMLASPEYRAAIPDRERAFAELRTFLSDPA
jgi:uncharacterized protein (DUF1330 family)